MLGTGPAGHRLVCQLWGGKTFYGVWQTVSRYCLAFHGWRLKSETGLARGGWAVHLTEGAGPRCRCAPRGGGVPGEAATAAQQLWVNGVGGAATRGGGRALPILRSY